MVEELLFEKLKRWRPNETEWFYFVDMVDTEINNIIDNTFEDVINSIKETITNVTSPAIVI